jgi:uncharacterized protein
VDLRILRINSRIAFMNDRNLVRTARTRIRRVPERARYDRETVHRVVDAAWHCHVAFTDKDGVHCLPLACWRVGDSLYLHGSNGSRTLRSLAAGAELCVAMTHLDGLVLARSAFHHSMNYRSLVIYGRCERVPEEEKAMALGKFMHHIAPGRELDARTPDRNELAATLVLRLPIVEAVVKTRAGSPSDDPRDLLLEVWAGVLPMHLQRLPARPDATCTLQPPEYVRRWTGVDGG